MTAPEILRDLAARGVELEVRDGQLLVRARRSVLRDEVVRAELDAVKPHMIDLLAGPITHRRADPSEQCDRCRELETKGIRVIACSECDRRIDGS